MTRGIRVAVACLLLAPGARAAAQGFAGTRHDLSSMLGASWEASFPRGGLRDFAGASSLRGAQFEARFALAPRFSLGVASSWSWLARNEAAGSIAFPDALLTGPVYRRVQVLTLRATAHVYLARGSIQPYLGVGVGGAYGDALVGAGDLRREQRGWGLAADPQLGLLVSIRAGFAIHAQARWQLTRNEIGGVRRAEWLAGSVGVAVY